MLSQQLSGIKNLPASAEEAGLTPGSGRSLGEGNGNPLHYSCLENPMDRRTWWATVHGVTKELNTTQQLNNKNHLSSQRLIFRNFFLDIPSLKPEFKKQHFMSEHHRRWKHMLWFSLPHPFTPPWPSNTKEQVKPAFQTQLLQSPESSWSQGVILQRQNVTCKSVMKLTRCWKWDKPMEINKSSKST